MQARVEHGGIADELGQFLSQKTGGTQAVSAARGLKQGQSFNAVTVPRLPSDLREASKIASVEDELFGCGGCAADPCGEGNAEAKKMPISTSQAAGREMPEAAYCYVNHGAAGLRDDSARDAVKMPAMQCNSSVYGVLLMIPLLFVLFSGHLDGRPTHTPPSRNSTSDHSSHFKMHGHAHSLEEMSKLIAFQPGTLGMNVDNISGAILSVTRGGKAFDAGVKQGWNISHIDRAPFDIEALKKKVLGKDEYKLTFLTKKENDGSVKKKRDVHTPEEHHDVVGKARDLRDPEDNDSVDKKRDMQDPEKVHHHPLVKMRDLRQPQESHDSASNVKDLRDPEVLFGTMGHNGASPKHNDSEPYDCLTRGSWSQVKQEWCCKAHGKRCQSTTPEPFRCHGASMPDWAPAKQVYCCVHHKIGCRDDAAPVEAQPAVAFDCKSGLWNYEKLWSTDKQVWCCLHKGEACPKMFK